MPEPNDIEFKPVSGGIEMLIYMPDNITLHRVYIGASLPAPTANREAWLLALITRAPDSVYSTHTHERMNQCPVNNPD